MTEIIVVENELEMLVTSCMPTVVAVEIVVDRNASPVDSPTGRPLAAFDLKRRGRPCGEKIKTPQKRRGKDGDKAEDDHWKEANRRRELGGRGDRPRGCTYMAPHAAL